LLLLDVNAIRLFVNGVRYRLLLLLGVDVERLFTAENIFRGETDDGTLIEGSCCDEILE
jgi:hypothetical protein